jgi:DNA (cytosine-5)-methyltransferase 1
VACSEVVPERAEMLRAFFPNASVHEGDIWQEKDALTAEVDRRLNGRRPFLLVMSPPCQGMSSNGAGRITAAISKGTRPKEDKRNRLVLPALDIIDALQPEVVLLENVKHMQRTTILNEFDLTENAIDTVRRRLSNYRIEAKVIDATWYGVPQRRERLILIATRTSDQIRVPLHCAPTHNTPISVHDAIGHLPWLDAVSKTHDSDDIFHHVPRWSDHQHFCMLHTPSGATAFDNLTCVHCGKQGAKEDALCSNCNNYLPRPLIVKKEAWCTSCNRRIEHSSSECTDCHGPITSTDKARLVRAFRTAYRRMESTRPASTLTTNSAVISSDVKGHPTEERVLSVREVMIVASLTSSPIFEAPWNDVVEGVFRNFPPKTIRDVAGESIPPLVTFRLVEHLRRHLGNKIIHSLQ